MIGRLYALPGNADFTGRLARRLGVEAGILEVHRFPDGETLPRFHTRPEGHVALVCSLAHPDPQALALLFAAHAAHSQGARSVGLVAPYLPYLRQDSVFQPGEALTSRTFSELLAGAFDWMVTVDPHLHRYRSLDALYRIPAEAVAAAPLIADWIRDEISEPLLVGPDVESTPWVSAIAARIGAPFVTFAKQRFGDRSVVLAAPDLGRWKGRAPVLVDDVISTGSTALRALHLLREAGFADTACVATHALFAEGVADGLRAAGASRLVTTDTVPHPTNGISVVPALADALARRAAAA